MRNRTFVIGAVVVAVLAVGWPVAVVSSREDRTITVTDKERVCDSHGHGEGQKCRYLVYTEQGTFEVTDSWLALRFNSSDVYGRIKEGATYDVVVQGWRVPFTSSYPNIIKVKEAR